MKERLLQTVDSRVASLVVTRIGKQVRWWMRCDAACSLIFAGLGGEEMGGGGFGTPLFFFLARLWKGPRQILG